MIKHLYCVKLPTSVSYLVCFYFCYFRTKLQRPEINEGQLLEILRQKDSQIVGLESMDREKQRELDLKQSELDKLQEEMKVYKDLIEV